MILKNLWRRATRSILTVLGIAIGVAAVVALGALADGFASNYGNALGVSNDLLVTQANSFDVVFSNLDADLAQRIEAVPDVATVEPGVFTWIAVGDVPYFLVYGYDSGTVAMNHYRIVEGKVVWELDPVRMHADDAFAAEMRTNNGSGSRGSERREAAEWLREELADGPKPASEVIEAGEHCGFTKRTVQRAFSEIGGERKKGEFNGPWLWSLPADRSPTLFSPAPKLTAPPATRELASSERESS